MGLSGCGVFNHLRVLYSKVSQSVTAILPCLSTAALRSDAFTRSESKSAVSIPVRKSIVHNILAFMPVLSIAKASMNLSAEWTCLLCVLFLHATLCQTLAAGRSTDNVPTSTKTCFPKDPNVSIFCEPIHIPGICFLHTEILGYDTWALLIPAIQNVELSRCIAPRRFGPRTHLTRFKIVSDAPTRLFSCFLRFFGEFCHLLALLWSTAAT